MPIIRMINRVYPPTRGATGRLMHELAVYLTHRGWAVDVLCCGPVAGTYSFQGVSVTEVAAPAGQTWRESIDQVNALAAALPNQRACDLTVILSDPPLVGSLGQIVKSQGGLSVHWVQDLYPDLFSIVGDPDVPADLHARDIAGAAFTGHDAVIAIDHAMADRIGRAGVDPASIHVVPNWADHWTDLADWDAQSIGTDAVGQGLRLVHAGSLGRLHGMAGVLDAMAIVSAQRPAITLTVAGGGSRKPQFDHAVTARGLDRAIRCLPWQSPSALRRLIAQSDLALVVMDQRAAGMAMPCKAHLALSLGTPVLFCGPNDTGFGQALVAADAGCLAPQNDGAALADVIRGLADNPATLATLRRGAEALAPSQTCQAGVRRMEAALTAILARDDAPQPVPALIGALPTEHHAALAE